MKGRPPGRATWFKFYGQRYLMGGSLRAECLPDERAVWLDFLCMANASGGVFDTANRDALAVQLLITRELLDRAIKKHVEAGRLTVRFDKRERKEIFTVVKWEWHQRGEKKESPPIPPSLKEENKERYIEREKEDPPNSDAHILQKDEKGAADFSTLPEVPEDFAFSEKDLLREKLAQIRGLERLRFDEHERQIKGFTLEELEKAIEKARKGYARYIEDRT